MITGCYTALVTPFTGEKIDYIGLEKLIDFQISNGITGILAAGTTSESPTLTWDEHNNIIKIVAEKTKNNCICIAGTGSNNTKEALMSTEHASKLGVDAVLLVDPYYNSPSSLEIRKEYIEPVAQKFPDVDIIPYIIPGRTGAQLLPQDLAILSNNFKNVKTVKEATANIENMKMTREYCGPEYLIFSGDDALIYQMMTDTKINASGGISVASNIAPFHITKLIQLISEDNLKEAKSLVKALDPLFNITTIITNEKTPYGEVTCRARNPLAVKSLMSILGMPSGHCRKPLGKMTKNGIEKVVHLGQMVQNNNPEIFKPISDFFNIDVEERLNNEKYWANLYYKNY